MSADRFLGAVVIEQAIQRGATRAEVIELCVRAKRMDVARAIQLGKIVLPEPAEGET